MKLEELREEYRRELISHKYTLLELVQYILSSSGVRSVQEIALLNLRSRIVETEKSLQRLDKALQKLRGK